MDITFWAQLIIFFVMIPVVFIPWLLLFWVVRKVFFDKGVK